MRKRIGLLLISVFFIFSCSKSEKVKDDGRIIYKHGIGFINGEPRVMRQSKYCKGEPEDIIMLVRGDVSLKKDGNRLIHAVNFGMKNDHNIYTIDRYLSGNYDKRKINRYKHKIENNYSYVSPDGKEWDRLIIKVIDDKKHKYDSHHRRVMILSLECKWFKGVYNFNEEGN